MSRWMILNDCYESVMSIGDMEVCYQFWTHLVVMDHIVTARLTLV